MIPVTVIPYGVSGIKPKPTRRPIYNPDRIKSEDAMDQPGLTMTDTLFHPPAVRSIEEILEEIEELHIEGVLSLDDVIEELSRCGSS